MVHKLNKKWNHFERSLRSFQVKLNNLGLMLKNDQIIYLKDEINYPA